MVVVMWQNSDEAVPPGITDEIGRWLAHFEASSLGARGGLPWVAKLDPGTLPTGSDRPWVSKSADGLLVLKP